MTLSLARFAGLAAATVAAVCGLGAWPTWITAGADGLVSMALAAAVLLLASIVGWLPQSRLAPTSDPETRVQAVMAGLGLRMGVSLVGVLALLFTNAAPHRLAFLAWVGLDYAVLLIVETRLAMRGGGSSDSHSPTPTAGGAASA